MTDFAGTMQTLLFLIPFSPGVSALCLGFWGPRLPQKAVGIIGAGSIGVTFLLVGGMAVSFQQAYSQSLWTWMRIGDFRPQISFRMDALSLVMLLVISSVSLLIHLYSIDFMKGEKGYSRFFAYLNLFVASMYTLVLADNLLLLYLGWEGVGLCSYLLIGFWYTDPANGRAARKAFLVTRIGDTAMAVGLFLLFLNFRTLEIQNFLQQAAAQWTLDSRRATVVAALLLGGAVGKSAQLPLQTWLPDAMAGPTPVSALIHAATMVTAGVYLIARMHTLFELAPSVQFVVAWLGAVSLLLAAFSALAQTDIKRVLAYSTMSQVGYMFLALGVGAWSAAIFHLMTHAFFKALLFLAAGAVIQSLHHEHQIFRMGGLRKEMPVVFWCFLIGAASLSALPFVTSGFYSKEAILNAALLFPRAGPWLWGAGILGAYLTSLYSFRLVFLVFFGEARTKMSSRPHVLLLVPLIVLAVLSIFSGLFRFPSSFQELFAGPLTPSPGENAYWPVLAASLVSLLGIVMASILYRRPMPSPYREAQKLGSPYSFLNYFWSTGWGFDGLYDRLIVRPFFFLAFKSRKDVVDRFVGVLSWVSVAGNQLMSRSQSGKLRWYAAWLGIGAAVLAWLVGVP